MKKSIEKLSDEFLSAYPIKNIIEGWYFKIDEVSNGVYEIEGIDYWNRRVSHKGINPDELLKLCVKDAEEIKQNIEEQIN